MGGRKIEVTINVAHQTVARGAGLFEGRPYLFAHLAEKRLQREAVQILLTPEVIVEKSFIDVRGSGDGVRARAFQALFGEDFFGGGHDTPNGGRVARAGQS